MPEGDTVYAAARRLRVLDGHVVTTSDFRVPQHATADLVGATVVTTVSRGKHLLTRFAPADASPPITLHTHLKMEGVWHVHAPGSRWRRPAFEARVVLRTAAHEAVGFALGVVELVPTAEEDRVVGHLGPDLLGPDWDEDEAVRRMIADPERPVGEVLLDQRCLAGVGSVYRSELCFVAGVHPRTPIAQVADVRRLARRAHQMLDLNKNRVERTTTGDTRRGRQLWVYGKRGTPCPRCGTPVRRDEMGPEGQERIVYWCPSCQPGRD